MTPYVSSNPESGNREIWGLEYRNIWPKWCDHANLRADLWYNSYAVRFDFDPRKSQRLRDNPRRGIGFEEAQAIFARPYYLDQRSDLPEQYRAIGWVGERLYSLIFEMREDNEGEFYHLVTLWKSTREEEELYAENT